MEEQSRVAEDIRIKTDSSHEIRPVKCSSCDLEIHTNTIELYPDLFSLSVDPNLGKIVAFECQNAASIKKCKSIMIHMQRFHQFWIA